MAADGKADQAVQTLVMAWGANDCGQCMLGREVPEWCPQPGLVASLEKRNVGHVFAGYDVSCAIAGSGMGTERLYAGGSRAGRLLGEDDGETDAADAKSSAVARRVAFDELEASRIVAVSGGRDHLVGITDAGALISWGRSNEFGQLGHGRPGALQSCRPSVVPGLPPLYKVVAVACGEYATFALLASGEVYAWGANDHGQLGLGDTEPRSSPTRLGGATAGLPVRAIAAGQQHTLALSRSGRVYSWGNNRYGRLGLGDAAADKASQCVLSPQLVESVAYAKHVSAGGAHSAVVVHKGLVLTAGDNRCGQLGVPISSLSSRSFFGEVQGTWARIRLVSCGSQHTLCLTEEGQVFGFGCNAEGQLGTGTLSPYEESPVLAKLIHDSQRVLVYSMAVTADHACVLVMSTPERRDQLHRYLSEGSGTAMRTSLRRPATAPLGSDPSRPLTERAYSVGGLSLTAPFTADDDDGPGLHRTDSVAIPHRPLPAKRKNSLPLGCVVEEEPTNADEGAPAVPAEEDAEDGLLHPSLSQGCTSPLTRKQSCIKYKLPDDGSEQGVVLLKQLVQPGVACKAFAALSASDLLSMVRTARESGEWRELSRSLGTVLSRSSVLNASFHFPGLREPRLAVETLYEALALTGPGPESFKEAVIEAAAKGLDDFAASLSSSSPQTKERLRGLIPYLLLPQLRDPSLPQQRRHLIVEKVALFVALLSPEDRQQVLELIVSEVPQAFLLRSALVPAVRNFINERVRTAAARQSLADPALWWGILLMQVLFLANQRLKEDQSCQLNDYGASHATLQHRFLRNEEFHITALNESTIPPESVFGQLVNAFGIGKGAADIPSVNDIVFGSASHMGPDRNLPKKLCVFMTHRNLIPVAFKQKVLQFSNRAQQDLHFQQQMREQPIFLQQQFMAALMTGQAMRPCILITVRRDNIVDDTYAFLRQTEPQALHLPLKVRFLGEEGLDEGGVRREFFQVLIRRLFDKDYGMFVQDPDVHTTWFNLSAPDLPDSDTLYKLCGTVIGLAVYNNEDGIQIHFPLALFKKLKGEAVSLADLEDVKPKVWMSLQQLLNWRPSTDDPNKEFEDLFCLTFAATYDVFGETRTQELKPGGEQIPVNFDTRKEYVDLYVDWLLNSSVEKQFKTLAEGFAQVVDSALWSLLTAEEAHMVVCWEPDLDFQDLRKGSRYNGFSPDEPYIKDFWEVLNDFTMEQRKKFLAFTTGCDRAPLGGLNELHLTVQKNGAEPTNRLPTAHTCFNLLLLPEYESKAKLRSCLLTAIDNSEGFGLQ